MSQSARVRSALLYPLAAGATLVARGRERSGLADSVATVIAGRRRLSGLAGRGDDRSPGGRARAVGLGSSNPCECLLQAMASGGTAAVLASHVRLDGVAAVCKVQALTIDGRGMGTGIAWAWAAKPRGIVRGKR